MLKRYGIDITKEAEEVRNEFPVAPLKDEMIGPMSRRIMESTHDLGYNWHKLDKFIYQDRWQTNTMQKRIKAMKILFVFWVIMLITMIANAEMVMWVDENGVKHFSNAGAPQDQSIEIKTEAEQKTYDGQKAQQQEELRRQEVMKEESILFEENEQIRKKNAIDSELQRTKTKRQMDKQVSEKNLETQSENVSANDNYTETNDVVEIPKWYGPGGYIQLKNGKLYFGGTIYYPSKNSADKWHGPGGYIRLKDGKLYTPSGRIYYPSKK